jgi:hypothetical protein
MRISRDKLLSDPIQIAPEEVQSSIGGRKKELAALIQGALKVGADLSAREAGRRAFAEFVKLTPDLQPATGVSVAATGQVLFTATKRRRVRPAAV